MTELAVTIILSFIIAILVVLTSVFGGNALFTFTLPELKKNAQSVFNKKTKENEE